MDNILKLLNRIDNNIETKNTQELLIDLGNSEKASKRIEVTKEKLNDYIEELQSLLDEKENVDYIENNLSIFSNLLESVFYNTSINLDKLKENSIGREELYKYLDKIISKK